MPNAAAVARITRRRMPRRGDAPPACLALAIAMHAQQSIHLSRPYLQIITGLRSVTGTAGLLRGCGHNGEWQSDFTAAVLPEAHASPAAASCSQDLDQSLLSPTQT